MPPISFIQRRIANISVGPSAVRGQPKETVNIVRNYLKSMDLLKFSNVKNNTNFQILLNEHTGLLKN